MIRKSWSLEGWMTNHPDLPTTVPVLTLRVLGSRKALWSGLLASRTLLYWISLCGFGASSCPSQLGWENFGSFQLKPRGRWIVCSKEAQVLSTKKNSSRSSSQEVVHTLSRVGLSVFLSLPATAPTVPACITLRGTAQCILLKEWMGVLF